MSRLLQLNLISYIITLSIWARLLILTLIEIICIFQKPNSYFRKIVYFDSEFSIWLFVFPSIFFVSSKSFMLDCDVDLVFKLISCRKTIQQKLYSIKIPILMTHHFYGQFSFSTIFYHLITKLQQSISLAVYT